MARYSVTLVFTLVLCLAACGGGETGTSSRSATSRGVGLSPSQAAAVATAAAIGPERPAGANPTAAAVATPHPETPDPCVLVTLAEAESVLGARPFPGSLRRSRDSAEVRCTYDALVGGQPGSVVVAVWKGSEARPVYELRRTAYGQGATIEDVRGLGDRAFTVQGDDGWINILKGDIYLSVQVDHAGLTGQERRTRAMNLARMVVSRL